MEISAAPWALWLRKDLYVFKIITISPIICILHLVLTRWYSSKPSCPVILLLQYMHFINAFLIIFFFNQSIKSSICKAPLKQSSQRRLL